MRLKLEVDDAHDVMTMMLPVLMRLMQASKARMKHLHLKTGQIATNSRYSTLVIATVIHLLPADSR